MSVTSSASLPVIETPDTLSPCTGCHAGCCRGAALPLTGRNIFRIVTELKVPFWKFVCRWADPSCAPARGIAPHFFFDDDCRTPYVIGLRQTESRVFPGTQKCVFLEESAPDECAPPTGRCSIYEHRPTGCRVYPSRLDEAGTWGTRDVPGPAGERVHEAYRLCQRPWSVFDFDLEGASTTCVRAGPKWNCCTPSPTAGILSPAPGPSSPTFSSSSTPPSQRRSCS